MINVLGKVNKDNYKEFTNSDFFGYEVFLGSEDDFKYLPEMMRRLNIISVHQPSKDFNLCSDQEIGDKSFKVMLRMLSALNESGHKGIVVVHGALFDETTSAKEKHFKILAERINKLAESFPEIKITLETDILFFNQALGNRALLALPEDFILLKKYIKNKLYITLDFEHVLISWLFNDFISKNKSHDVEIKSLASLKRPEIIRAKAAWLGYLEKNKNRFGALAAEAFKKYEKLSLEIIHFHLNGSDMSQYWFDGKTFLPLRGEHLTINQTEDKMNYRLVKDNLLKLAGTKPKNVVLEIWPRRINKYVSELKKSGKLIKKYVK